MPSRTRNRKKAKQKTSLAALPGARTQEEHSNNGPTYVQDENLAQGDGERGVGGGRLDNYVFYASLSVPGRAGDALGFQKCYCC